MKGPEARKLYDDARKYLAAIINESLLTAKGVFGLYPAVFGRGRIRIFTGKSNKDGEFILNFLRNQEPKEKGIPNLCLADFIAPASAGLKDHIGLFVVTADLDEKALKKYVEDDFAIIMIRILSDRLAEAAAEYLHEKIRREYWGYAQDEDLTPDEMFRLKFKGIRPARDIPHVLIIQRRGLSSGYLKRKK